MKNASHRLPLLDPCGSTLIVVSILSIGSGARAEPRGPTHIACIGDSITQGAGASSPEKNYVSVLQGLLGDSVQVKNFGRSGATMLSEGFGDLPYTKQVEFTNATNFVKSAGGDAVVSVIINLGANDSKPHNWEPKDKPKNDGRFLEDYRALVEHFLNLSTKPVVYVAYPLATGNNPCCSIRGDVIRDEQIPLIHQLATEKHLPIIDLNTGTTGHPEYFGDGVHPNDAGYAVMAGLVKAGIEREPAVRITDPRDGSWIATELVSLTATTNDTVLLESVEFFAGNSSLGKVSSAPFTLEWAVTPGSHEITAYAIDATRASAKSAPITFTALELPLDPSAGGGSSDAGAAGMPSNNENGGTTNEPGSEHAGHAGRTARHESQADAGCSCSLPKDPSSNQARLFVTAIALWAIGYLARRSRSGASRYKQP